VYVNIILCRASCLTCTNLEQNWFGTRNYSKNQKSYNQPKKRDGSKLARSKKSTIQKSIPPVISSEGSEVETSSYRFRGDIRSKKNDIHKLQNKNAQLKRPADTEDSEDEPPLSQRRKTDSTTVSNDYALIHTSGYSLSDVIKHAKVPAHVNDVLENYSAKRALDWRPLYQGNLKYRFNVQAAISFIVGDIVSIPCEHCSRGKGPFATCIV